jgi:hypothetical protein
MNTSRPFRLPLVLPLLTAIVLAVAFALTGCSKRELTEDQAVELVSKQVIADQRYPASQNGACLAFQVERASQSSHEIAVREKHGDGCPGDPGTGPVVDRFEVQDNGKLRLYDPVAGSFSDYVPADKSAKP